MGRIVAPFGVQGWVKIQPLGDDPLSWRKMSQWWVGKNPESLRSEDWRVVRFSGLRAHGKGVVAVLDGVSDRTAAEEFSGCYIAAPREALPAPGKDEFYWADLIGLRVVGQGGVDLGVVRQLIDTGAHAVLEVDGGDQERLIPFVAEFILSVDLAKGEIHADWGLDW